MKRDKFSLSLAVFLLIFAVDSRPSFGDNQSRILLEGEKIESIYSAAWDKQEDCILLTDTWTDDEKRARRGYCVSRNGRAAPRKDLDEALGASKDSNWIVVKSEKKIVQRSADLKRIEHNLKSMTKESSVQILSIYDWAIKDNKVVAYGAFLQEETGRPYELGFFTVPLSTKNSSAKVEVIDTYNDDALAEFYTFGHPYFAAGTRDVYYLDLHPNPDSVIRRYNPRTGESGEIAKLSEVFSDLGMVMSIKSKEMGRDRSKIYKVIEKSTMPAGIYAHGGKIFVLYRSQEGGKAKWYFAKISLANDSFKQEGVWVLPTQAPHLNAVPAPDGWYFIEKGSVKEAGNQDIKTMLWLDDSWFEKEK